MKKKCGAATLVTFKYYLITGFLILIFRSSTPLHLAVLVHNNDILTLLLDEHARSSKIDLNAQTADDHTPLYYALINTLKLDTDDSFANRLVAAGANPNPVSSSRCHILNTRNYTYFVFLTFF